MTESLKKNKTLKVAAYCLFTAATFWLFTAMSKDYSTTFYFPVHYNLPDTLTASTSKQDIEIAVLGPGWNILARELGVQVDPLEIQVSLAGQYAIKTNKYNAYIRKQLPGLILQDVNTDILELTVIQSND
jgi:hypothetical protein